MGRPVVHVIEASYDSGMGGFRMGAGPAALIGAGLLDRLHEAGFEPVHVRLSEGAGPEIAATFALQAEAGREIARASACGAFPLVLSGNCNTGTVGGAAGHAASDLGVLWMDAHADNETPDTTSSGFLDGMGLAMLQGRTWREQLRRLNGFQPIGGERVILLGARDIGEAEGENLRLWGVRHVPVAAWRQDADLFEQALGTLKASGARRLMIHVDADVHDPDMVAPANDFAAPGGLGAQEVVDAATRAARALPLASASIAAYDPKLDPEKRMAGVLCELAVTLVRAGVR